LPDCYKDMKNRLSLLTSFGPAGCFYDRRAAARCGSPAGPRSHRAGPDMEREVVGIRDGAQQPAHKAGDSIFGRPLGALCTAHDLRTWPASKFQAEGAFALDIVLVGRRFQPTLEAQPTPPICAVHHHSAQLILGICVTRGWISIRTATRRSYRWRHTKRGTGISIVCASADRRGCCVHRAAVFGCRHLEATRPFF